MMTVILNQQALESARRLLDEGHYLIYTVWGTSAPSPDEETHYAEHYGWDAYAGWYLGIDTDEPVDSKPTTNFPTVISANFITAA